MSTELPDPEHVVRALVAAGWTHAGQRTGLYKRLYWPGVTDMRGRSIVVPLNPDFADYRDLMTAALDELKSAAEVGRHASVALAGIALDPVDERPVDGEHPCVAAEIGFPHPPHAYDVFHKHIVCPGSPATPTPAQVQP